MTENNLKIFFRKDKSQHKNKHAFVVEGGGTKGIYTIGFMKYIMQPNPHIDFDKIDIFGGTSAGSFIALCLSLGYCLEDLDAVSKIMDFSNLIDSNYHFLQIGYRFLTNGNFYDKSNLRKTVDGALKIKIGSICQDLQTEIDSTDLTFGHLKILIARYPHKYKHFVVNTVDLNRSAQIFFTSYDDRCDNIKLLDAVIASGSIPFVFQQSEFYYNEERDMYSHTPIDKGDCLNKFVDGGVSSCDPLEYFLLHEAKFQNHNLWLLKFTNKKPCHVIYNATTLFKALYYFLVYGKSELKMKLIEEKYRFSIINLECTANTLDLYTNEQIQEITEYIYNKCLQNDIIFESYKPFENIDMS